MSNDANTGTGADQRAKLAEIAEATLVTMALKGGVAIETRLAGAQASRPHFTPPLVG